jgi:hypothetical protein
MADSSEGEIAVTPTEHAAEILHILKTLRRGVPPCEEQRLVVLKSQHRKAIITAYAEARGWCLARTGFSLSRLAREEVLPTQVLPYPRTFMDHVWHFRHGSGFHPAAIVAHPYAYLEQPVRDALVAWGTDNGLRIAFPDDFPSWWFPGETSLIEIMGMPAAREEWC